ncbi:putative transposase [Pseudoxanthomonas sp. CF385]|uniref:REP-associated tyrosine transposase n=1 Tax=Pseudoxanthomonas sp. CF385 TaxID=1881042 RepID=UPI0008817073|nr:transposase [Pseudoxanthomonas sp. CF385]SDR12285.1 putative transposase [Pseudoxanthomonas sp. CF385]
MTHYRRAFVPGATYFFTVNLADRQATLLVDHIDLLRDAVRYTRKRHPFDIDAMVVLPDHLHAVWTLPPGDADFPLRWRLIKTWFSRHLPHGEHRRASHVDKSERGIWQRRYWEHVIRDETDLARHVDYIHGNPVKHGHVVRVRDWPYSTFHRFARNGILSEDWGSAGENASFGERR